MFKCQREPFLTQFETKVVSCEQVEDVSAFIKEHGPEVEVTSEDKLFQIILEDTILFPEGGGQPDDRGTIGGASVVRVIREGTRAIHFVVNPSSTKAKSNGIEASQNGEVLADNGSPSLSLPLDAGTTVLVQIDWTRRFDHMQQHSGQHLITAIADAMFGFATTSWYLAKDDSFIELDTPKITEDQIKQIEDKVNALIRQARPCTVDVVELDDPKLKTARGRNLPEDVKGCIRIVTMEGVESNVCCGTHVQNLSQLQAIKILGVTPKKGKSHLFFLCGDRLLRRFGNMNKREGELMKSLKTSPSDLVSASDKMNVALKTTKKLLLNLTKDLASLEAKRFLEEKSAGNNNPIWHFHRDNVEPDYAPVFIREIGPVKRDVILFLTFKQDAQSGNIFLIRGEDVLNPTSFSAICEEISTLLGGKGCSRGNQFQAKITKVSSINKAVSLLENALQNSNS